MPKYSVHILIILTANYIPFNLQAQGRNGLFEIANKQIRLISDDGNYRLQITVNDMNTHLSIPVHWLTPEEPEQNEYVSLFNYDSTVTVFDIGSGLSGIHISSYDIQQDGSAQAAAGRDIFLVYAAEENKVYPGLVDLDITKDRVRSAGTFYATNSYFLLADINFDGFKDIGVIKEALQFSPHDQSYFMYPVEWYVFNEHSWIHQADSSGKFPSREMIKLPLIGLGKSPVDYIKERYLHRNICVLEYEDFGVQAMAYDLIGYQWYQWNNHGDPDPDARYDIKVVVYKDMQLRKVKELYPVVKELRQDFRHVEYNRAIYYFDRHIQEIEELRQAEPQQGNLHIFEDLKSTLLKTREKIVHRLR